MSDAAGDGDASGGGPPEARELHERGSGHEKQGQEIPLAWKGKGEFGQAFTGSFRVFVCTTACSSIPVLGSTRPVLEVQVPLRVKPFLSHFSPFLADLSCVGALYLRFDSKIHRCWCPQWGC